MFQGADTECSRRCAPRLTTADPSVSVRKGLLSAVLFAGIAVLAACTAGESIDLSAGEPPSITAPSIPSVTASEKLTIGEESIVEQPSNEATSATADACRTLEGALDSWEEGRDILLALKVLQQRSKNAADAVRESRFRPAVRTVKQFRTIGSSLTLDLPNIPLGSDANFEELVSDCEDADIRQRALSAQDLLSDVKRWRAFLSNEAMYKFPYFPTSSGLGLESRGKMFSTLLYAFSSGNASKIGLEETSLPGDFLFISGALEIAITKGQRALNE